MSHSTLSIQEETKDKMEKFRSPGQSFDGVIREMIQKLEENSDSTS